MKAMSWLVNSFRLHERCGSCHLLRSLLQLQGLGSTLADSMGLCHQKFVREVDFLHFTRQISLSSPSSISSRTSVWRAVWIHCLLGPNFWNLWAHLLPQFLLMTPLGWRSWDLGSATKFAMCPTAQIAYSTNWASIEPIANCLTFYYCVNKNKLKCIFV